MNINLSNKHEKQCITVSIKKTNLTNPKILNGSLNKMCFEL